MDIRTNEEKAYLWKKMSEIYSAFGAEYTAAELKRTYKEMVAELVSKLPENGEPDLNKVFEGMFLKKGVPCDSVLCKSIAVTFRALSRKKLEVYEGVKETLEELRRRGKKIYLLSNAQSDFTRPEIAMRGLTPYLDDILISSEIGFKKPAVEFYDALIHKYSLNPKDCLMVGNDEFSDVQGAINVGMDSLYIHTEISPEMSVESRATYVVMDGDWKKVSKILLAE